jgi:uncharacterized protein
MTLLLISIGVLAAAPLLYLLARVTQPTLALLDGFVFVVIGGLVLIHIIPESVQVAGWWALLALFAGLMGPGYLEKGLHRAAAKAHTFALLLALAGLAFHGFLDGVALLDGGDAHGSRNLLAVAVVLHRIPVGLTILWLLIPRYGWRWAAGALGAIAVATLAGYAMGGAFISDSTRQGLSIFQALVAGSLLHVVIHSPDHIVCEHEAGRWNINSGMGAVLAVVVLYYLGESALHHGSHAGEHAGHHAGDLLGGHLAHLAHAPSAFWSLAEKSALPLLIAYLGAGLLHGFLPRASMAWLGRRGPLAQSFKGVAFGLPLPVCSCGVIPLYQGLITRGAPASAAMAFLVATPEIGIDALLLSIPLLGSELTLARVLAASIVAILVGWIVGGYANKLDTANAPAACGDDPMPSDFGQRLRISIRAGLAEVVDNTAPWIILGLAVAAGAVEMLDTQWLAALPQIAMVPLMAILGMPVYVCASGATPMVAMLILKGISPGAALAFLLTGPATNITTFGVLSQLHGRRVAISFGLSVGALAIICGYLVDAFLPGYSVPALSDAHLETHSLVFLGLLAVLYMLSILRQGPRRFVGQVLPAALSHEHHDDGHDHHGHDHHGH